MDEYDRVTRCKCNYRRKKTQCVRIRPDPTVESKPMKRVSRRCPCGYRYNKITEDCLPGQVEKPVLALQPKIQVERVGKKCPPTLKYNTKTNMCEKCPDGTRKYRNQCLLIPTKDDQKPSEEKKEEVILPVPDLQEAKPPPYSLAEYINEMADIGKKIHDPRYKAGRYMIFIYIYLIRKYATSCSIFRDSFHLSSKAILNYEITTDELDYPSNLGHQMLQCVLRGTELIFITLLIYRKQEDGGGSHVNILIYRPFKKIIERYEPHGQETHMKDFNDYILNRKLKHLFEEELEPKLKEYTPKYKTPYEICPSSRGFQGIENLLPHNAKESGYCQMWVMFMMESTLLNPTLNTADIIEKCIEVGKRNPEYFKNLIRGYTFQLAKEIQKFLGPSFDFSSDKKEAFQAFNRMDISKLIQETMAETSKRYTKMPSIHAEDTGYKLSMSEISEIEKHVNGLPLNIIKLYCAYLLDPLHPIYKPDEIIYRVKESIHSDKLKTILLSRNITWDKLTLDMYNDLFLHKADDNLLIRCKYVLLFDSYPNRYVDRNLSIHIKFDKVELMEIAKKKYPFFHDFWFGINKLKSSPTTYARLNEKEQKSLQSVIKKLSLPNVNKYLSLILHKNPDTDIDVGKPTQSLDEKREQLSHHVISNNLTLTDMDQWSELFK